MTVIPQAAHSQGAAHPPGLGAKVWPLIHEVRHNPLMWLLVFVPALLAARALSPEAHTLLFLLSVLAIVPLAALLSRATESVAAKTGDAVGGLLNATLGNLTELIIALAALRAGQYVLVKASNCVWLSHATATNSALGYSRSVRANPYAEYQCPNPRIATRHLR